MELDKALQTRVFKKKESIMIRLIDLAALSTNADGMWKLLLTSCNVMYVCIYVWCTMLMHVGKGEVQGGLRVGALP